MVTDHHTLFLMVSKFALRCLHIVGLGKIIFMESIKRKNIIQLFNYNKFIFNQLIFIELCNQDMQD